MILVVGATGILGGKVTMRLLTQCREVRILVRHNSASEKLALQGMATTAQSLIKAGALPVYGDLKDVESLNAACKNIETVITTANSAMRGGEDTVDTVDRQGNRILIEAATKAKVKQFIFISFFGADLNHPMPLFKAKAETEVVLINSGMNYTILSPNYFMESWISLVVGIPLQAHQPVTLVGKGRREHSLISNDDVSTFSTAVIGHPQAVNQKLPLGGPEPLSWCGIVDTFSNILGIEIPIRFVAPGEGINGLPEFVTAMLAGMETYDSILPMKDIAQTYHVKQITLDSFARNMLNLPKD
jgi:uncharacterized protein YbjT (DUF2867 family)